MIAVYSERWQTLFHAQSIAILCFSGGREVGGTRKLIDAKCKSIWIPLY